MNIIIDAMGGDNAPGEILHGAAGAVREYGIAVTAVGDSAAIEKAAKEGGIPMQGITVVHAGEVISMHDEPTAAIRHKKDSSMAVGLRLLAEGKGDAFVSAGFYRRAAGGGYAHCQAPEGRQAPGHRRGSARRAAAVPAFGRGRECGMPP